MKILILSHNPITDYNSMGKTFLGLFEKFNPSEIVQLYIYPTLPNVLKCSGYFRITDMEAFKGILPFYKAGRVIDLSEIKENNTLYENPNQKVFYSRSKHRIVKILIRNFIWNCSHWNTTHLQNWLKEQNISALFVAPGASPFFYKLALEIGDFLNCPICSYICDDFYFSSIGSKGLWARCYKRELKNNIRKLLEKSKIVFTICDSLAEAYSSEFACKTLTLSTAANIKRNTVPIKNNSKSIVYLGSLHLNRYLSLIEIGKALDHINKTHKTNFELLIYSSCTDSFILDSFKNVSSIRFKGFVGGSDVYSIMKQSLMLLHVEAFDAISVERTKFSVSTKIADSLASGVCLFAYAPVEVASMQHLIKYKCAAVATSSKVLEEVLMEYLFSEQKREETIMKALETARLCHDSNIQSSLLYNAYLDLFNYENTSSKLCL